MSQGTKKIIKVIKDPSLYIESRVKRKVKEGGKINTLE
jgi:hypothetical protein